MEFKGIKINVVVLVALIILLAFFSGKYLLNVYNVQQPLLEKLSDLNGVQNVKLIDDKDKTDISFQLKPGVDFYKLYNQIEDVTSTQLKENKGKIIIDNDNKPELETIYYKLHYAIYEGIATNKFTEMKERIDKIANNNNLKNYKLWVDNDNVYLQLDEGDQSLYKVIPRKNNSEIVIGGESNG